MIQPNVFLSLWYVARNAKPQAGVLVSETSWIAGHTMCGQNEANIEQK